MARLRSLALCLALSAGGCGDWVRFAGDQQTTPAPTGGQARGFANVERLSHFALGDLMRRFVVPPSSGQATALFDYDRLAADPEARHALESYLAALDATDPSGLRDPRERLVYWINGYNASAVRAVIEKFDGERGFRATDGPFFNELLYRFGGVVLTLDQLEHAVLRGDSEHDSLRNTDDETRALFARWHAELWGDGSFDPRVHAVLNCTALSCPNLLHDEPFVYDAALIEAQLEQATRAWLADPLKGAGPDGISQLFEWFGADFEAAAGSIESFIETNRPGGLDGVDTTRRLDYDWTLNIAP